MDRSKYPPDWEQISLAIRARAGGYCEWCGAPNGAVGYRDARGYFWPLSAQDRQRESCAVGMPVFRPDGELTKVIRIVLTVAHLGAPKPGSPYPWGDPHDKHDVRPEGLAALCQRCHLGYDHLDHMRHAADTRRQKRITQGQTALAL